MRYFLLSIAVLMLILQSCGYKSRQVLFRFDEKPDTKDLPVYVVNPQQKDSAFSEHVTKVDDLLSIRFLNSYDLRTGVLQTDPTARDLDLTYLIHTDSTITLPIIGKVKVVGYTISQLRNLLIKQFEGHVVDPIIDVNIVSLSVSVMGEVNKPGTYQLNRQGMHLSEVLAMAGHLTRFARRKKVKIIRGDKSDPEIIIVDLRKIQAVKDERLIIRDRDIVYVEPVVGSNFSERVRPFVFLTSILSSLTTIFVILNKNV